MSAEAVATAGVSVRLSGNVPRSLVAGEVDSTRQLSPLGKVPGFWCSESQRKAETWGRSSNPGVKILVGGSRSPV